MNSKAIRKQLLAAVAMVLVAAVALGSSTYAWFAANNTVTAKTMSISAVSDTPSLVISVSEGGTYSEIANIESASAALKLVTPTNLGTSTTGAGLTWGYTTSTKAAEVQASNPTTDVTAQKAQHVLETTVYVKMASEVKGSNLKLNTVNLTKGTNSISDAVRVLAFVDGANNTYGIYDPASGVSTHTLATEVSTTAIPIHLYMYFDGMDDASYTNNATDLTQVSAVLTFTIDGTV